MKISKYTDRDKAPYFMVQSMPFGILIFNVISLLLLLHLNPTNEIKVPYNCIFLKQ